jgi:hypothetical protein
MVRVSHESVAPAARDWAYTPRAVGTTYDFLWQPQTAGAPLVLDSLEALLAEKGATRRPDGAWVWRFPRGEVVGLPVREAGQVVAFELKVPLQDKTELLSAVLHAASELAQAQGLRLLDPQLSRAVKSDDEGSVGDSYLRSARYAGEFLGVSDAIGATTLATPPSEGPSLGARLLLVLLVFGVVLFLTFRALSG